MPTCLNSPVQALARAASRLDRSSLLPPLSGNDAIAKREVAPAAGFDSPPARRLVARAVASVGACAVLAGAMLATGCGDGAHAGTGTSEETCVGRETGYLLPTGEVFQETLAGLEEGPFFMLNLLRLRDVPDYCEAPERAPETPIGGREAFDQFAALMDEELATVGAKIVFRADGGPALIGPSDEQWDIVQIAYYPSRQAFLDFTANEVVLDHLPDRIALFADSRITPLKAGLVDPPTD